MIKKELWGHTSKEECVYRYTLTNSNGTKAILTNLGAVLLSFITPDKNGVMADIVLGYPSLEDYFENAVAFGATIGRNANRIANASFSINNVTYPLCANEKNRNNLHSNPDGYHKRLWEVETTSDELGEHIRFFIESPDGDQGYPGHFSISVTYTLTEDNSLIIDYEGISDKDTIANLTNHSYFNLSGHDGGSVLDHIVWIDADTFTIADEYSIPTGELVNVTNTPMDFTTPTTIGARIDCTDYEPIAFGNGYDHNWALNNNQELQLVATATDKRSGRTLEVYTDLPGMQFYTPNFSKNSIHGKDGVIYNGRDGFCFETQYFPDAIHHENFPSPILKAGEPYRTTTIYRIVVEKE